MILDDVWAEIDLRSISHNMKQFRRILSPSSGLMAVLKANAYGHGIVEVAGRVLSEGAEMLGVARLAEAIEIRQAGFEVPILIFGHTPPEMAGLLIRHDLTQSLWSYEAARELSDATGMLKGKIKVHVKVDTGMGRLGILPGDVNLPQKGPIVSSRSVDAVESIKRLPGIDLEGIYTHFATADAADKSRAIHQFEIFSQFLDDLKNRGIEFKLRHTANSAAIIDMPETHLDMVRLGISLYGYYPSREVDVRKVRIVPVMTLKARIIHLKEVTPGFCVSYGATWTAAKPTMIATVSIGYADGLSRLLSSKWKMLVRGALAPVVGRICMDQAMLDVGGIPDLKVGDEVVVFGPHEALPIGADRVADNIGTISYEVVAGISGRVPRVYIR